MYLEISNMNSTKEFFDNKAEGWDKKEVRTQEFFDEFARRYFCLKPNMKVLDLGCGTGVVTNSIYKLTNASVTGLDLSTEMIKIARKKYEGLPFNFIEGDFYESKLNGYDSIICHNAYPHFADKQAFKNKCYSVLNKEGYLVICHSSSKERINSIHSDKCCIESCKLIPALEEAKLYLDLFDIVNIKDDDEAYVIALKKK